MVNNVIDLNKKRGKFYFGTMENYYQIEADIYLFCTTHSDTLPDGTVLVEELAPSLDLLLQKKAWLDKGIFCEHFEEFKEMYLDEMYTRADYKKAMNRIMEMTREGKTIVLFDNCNLGEYCHLNILKNEFKKMGYRAYDIKNNTFNNPLSSIRW